MDNSLITWTSEIVKESCTEMQTNCYKETYRDLVRTNILILKTQKSLRFVYYNFEA